MLLNSQEKCSAWKSQRNISAPSYLSCILNKLFIEYTGIEPIL